jgi:HlyD family secretion protein
MDRTIKKKRFTPKKIAMVAIPAVFLVTVIWMIVFGDRSSRLNVDVEKITISEVYRGEFQEYIPAQGTVLPIRTYHLSASEGGMVEERIIEAGTQVTKGDPMVRLSNTNLLLTILNNQAQVNRAANDLRSTRLMMEQNLLLNKSQLLQLYYNIQKEKRAFERAAGLSEKNLISKEEYELARDDYEYSLKRMELLQESMKQDSLFRMNQVEQLDLSLQQMKINLQIVEKKQEALTIRAPISGMLTSLDAEIGDTKSQGEQIGRIDVLTV